MASLHLLLHVKKRCEITVGVHGIAIWKIHRKNCQKNSSKKSSKTSELKKAPEKQFELRCRQKKPTEIMSVLRSLKKAAVVPNCCLKIGKI